MGNSWWSVTPMAPRISLGLLVTLGLAGAALALAGCGNSDSGADQAGGTSSTPGGAGGSGEGGRPAGASRAAAVRPKTRCARTPTATGSFPIAVPVAPIATPKAAFHAIAAVEFASTEDLQADLGSPGGQKIAAHAVEISTGGPPVFVICEKDG